MRDLVRTTLVVCLCASTQGWVFPNKAEMKQNQCWDSHRRSGGSSLSRPSTALYDSEEENEHEGMNHHMQVVRSLQATFYKSTTGNMPQQSLDLETGMFHNLPLWRVPWNEVPGRTNVLNVHDGVYTNMFETILHQPPPWYVGHLYLPGGSQNLKSPNPKYKLTSWEAASSSSSSTELQEKEWSSNSADESAVVGTILRIADFRRMVDGRLLLLVQAMERFVVADVQQEVPYSIAHVQIIPDTEEIEESNWRKQLTEGEVAEARAMAVQESFERWHRYEYENTMLPLPLTNDLEPSQVVGSALAKVLPYSPFSSVVQVSKLCNEHLKDPTVSSKSAGSKRRERNSADYTQVTLEERLVQVHQLSDPTFLDPDLTAMSMEELERELWVALDGFLKTTRKPVSPILLGLLPVDQKWPKGFLLERIAKFVREQTKYDHKYVRVSPEYPALRRQKRLSYSAAALLEDAASTKPLRRQLLSIPSTKDRLAFVLQQFSPDYGVFE